MAEHCALDVPRVRPLRPAALALRPDAAHLLAALVVASGAWTMLFAAVFAVRLAVFAFVAGCALVAAGAVLTGTRWLRSAGASAAVLSVAYALVLWLH